MKTPLQIHLFTIPSILGLTLLWGVGILPAQDLPFDSGSTGADGPLTFRTIPINYPGGRRDHALAFDEARQETVLFGGCDSSCRYVYGDTWVLNATTNWVQRFPSTSPDQRREHAMAYDAARQQLVLFGGTHYTGVPLNDTWVWDGTNWMERTPNTKPPARYDHAMAYDAAHQRIVMLGGGGDTRTWLWDGTDWSASLSNNPPYTILDPMAYDAIRQEVVLFRGNVPQFAPSETWVWKGTNWTKRSPLSSPVPRSDAAMAYDGVRGEILLFSGSCFDCELQDTWSWDGTRWMSLGPLTQPRGRLEAAMAFDTIRGVVVLYGGYSGYPGGSGMQNDTWFWDGTNWALASDSTQFFDMRSRPNGVWNFTTIDIPPTVTVQFVPNAANTPVRWLASGNVTINGTLQLSGASGTNTPTPGQEGRGGPGGFSGGLGGTRFDQSSSYAGAPGNGPGGGVPGVTNGAPGGPGTYVGNAYLQPLVGGSGGGGSGSGNSQNGGGGGGGGGAILIASSRDITFNSGFINANGNAGGSGAGTGGAGSGGAIRLQADRILGTGALNTTGPAGNNGRVRMEAYIRSTSIGSSPVAAVSPPVITQNFDTPDTLVIASAAGQVILQPPTGNTAAPDVIFTNSGPVTVIVTSTNIPNLTPVQLRITSSGQIITATNVLSGGTAAFTVTVPRGVGTIQASASFTINN